MLELGEQQQPRVGGQQVRDGLGRGVRTMRRAEGVVDVQIAPVGKLARETLVVRCLTGVEARVLEHLDPFVGEQLGEACPNRRDRVLRAVLVGLGTAEVRADAHVRRALVEQEAQRRQRALDPRVVGNAALLERNVQVGADEHDLAGDVGLAERSAAASLSQ